jgi:uncharacterized protein DUF4160
VPEISRFLGTVIAMFYSEHGETHFHAVYGEYEASVELDTGKVHGELPHKAAEGGQGASRRTAWRP